MAATIAHLTSFDDAVVWLARHRIMALEGEYDAEALAPLHAALSEIVGDTRKARSA